MFLFRRAALFAALFLCGMQAAPAQDVTLKSRDGLITLQGTMQSYDGEFYRVQTAYGLLTLDGQGVSCLGPGCPDLAAYVANLTLAAPNGTGGLLMALVSRFAAGQSYALHRDLSSDLNFRLTLSDAASGRVMARLAVVLTDSDQGLADLQSGKADLALSMLSLAGLPGTAQVLSLDAMVPVVAQSNPVRAISLPGLAAALSGQITNWQDLGGFDAPIVLHALPAGAGLQRAVEAQLAVKTAAAATRHSELEELVDAVAADPWALAVTSVSETGNAVPLALTGECGFALAASAQAVKSGDYPLVAPLILYAPDRHMPLVIREFSEWLSSPDAQLAVRAAGYIDQKPERIGLDAQGVRLAHAIAAAGPEIDLKALQGMVTALAGAERLTTSFRFQGGQRLLDAPSQGNVLSLAQALEAGVYDGQVLTFAGFSDGRGAAGANLRLSRQRAQVVRDAVVAAAPLMDPARVSLQIEAYGEAMPVACDDTDIGAGLNRRVEVWLQPQPQLQPVEAKDSQPSGN